MLNIQVSHIEYEFWNSCKMYLALSSVSGHLEALKASSQALCVNLHNNFSF